MRILLLLVVCTAAEPFQAQITGVSDWRRTARVLAVTAQQAILTYSVPSMEEGQPCAMEVSTSSAYTPVVPDVDGTLFPGANLDNRPGAYANGRVRTVILGRRTVETASDGNNYSRSLAAATTYYYRITCSSLSGSSVAAGAFATGLIPQGLGYGDPIPTDPNHPGKYLYPALSATDRAAATVDPHTGALVKNMTLPGDLKGPESINPLSEGFGQQCHPTPVKAFDEDKWGYHCIVQLYSGSNALYWIAPDGETRLLGILRTNWIDGEYNQIANTGTTGYLIDVTTPDPNTFWWISTGQNPSPPWSGNNHYVIKGVYTGHRVSGGDADRANINPTGNLPNTSFSVITPSDRHFDRSLEALLAEFDPDWTTYGTACCQQYNHYDFIDSKIVLYWDRSQDNFGWLTIFDPHATAATQTAKFGNAAGCIDNPPVTGNNYRGMAGCIVGSMGTFSGRGGSPFRYSVLHAVYAGLSVGSGMLQIGVNALRQQMGSAYQVQLPGGMPNSGTPCTMAQPGEDNYIADWPDSSWAAGCSTVSVSGDPTLTPPINGYPSTWAAAPGDLLSINSSSPSGHELARLLDKGSDGNTWYIQRQYSSFGLRRYDSVSPGGTLDMAGPGYGAGKWWDYTNGPVGTSAANTYLDSSLGTGHAAYQYSNAYGRWSVADGGGSVSRQAYYGQAGMEPDRFGKPAFQFFKPGFNGVGCAGNSFTPCAVESHPSLSILNPPDAVTYGQVLNNHPYTGDYTLVTAAEVTNAGGQLYRIRGTNVLSNYKKIAYFANSGNRAMRELSGPGVQLAADDSSQFQWCMAYQAGECYNGSVPGDIYFNAPNITNAYCTNNWNTLLNTTAVPNDICVSPAWSWTQAVTIQQLVSDPNGMAHRTISNSFGKYEGQSIFWNSRAVPDGSWLFTTVASDGMFKLFKIPPMARDAVDRTGYVPVTVKLPATTGADGAVVEFGYGEQGEGKFYCTARQESCEANAAAVNAANPFYFASEAYTPAPCAAGCTIVIPGIPGRIVEYRLKMFNGSVVSFTSPTMLAAVP